MQAVSFTNCLEQPCVLDGGCVRRLTFLLEGKIVLEAVSGNQRETSEAYNV